MFYLFTGDLAYLSTSKSIALLLYAVLFVIGLHPSCRDRLGLHLCGEGHPGCQEGDQPGDLLVVLVQEAVEVGSIEE